MPRTSRARRWSLSAGLVVVMLGAPGVAPVAGSADEPAVTGPQDRFDVVRPRIRWFMHRNRVPAISVAVGAAVGSAPHPTRAAISTAAMINKWLRFISMPPIRFVVVPVQSRLPGEANLIVEKLEVVELKKEELEGKLKGVNQ